MSDAAVQALKAKLRETGTAGLALDIDETLADTTPHWWRHMMKFHALDMDMGETLKRYTFIEYVPAWRTPQARAYIEEGIHSNEFQEAIPLLHESNAMIRKLHERVPIVAYISARPDTVGAGTIAWLDRHGFPQASVVLRPGRPGTEELETKNEWKAEVLAALFPEVIGIVDDNPGLPAALAKAGYRGKLFVYGPQVQALDPADYPFPVIISPTWNSVLDHFKNEQLIQ